MRSAVEDHKKTDKFPQFLILGAGTDTSFWRLAINDTKIKWFEIDFPHNLEMKRNLLYKEYGRSENYFAGT